MTHSQFIRDILFRAGAEEGDEIRIEIEGRVYEGILMPHHDFSNPETLIIKLKNGYNIGVRISNDARVVSLKKGIERRKKIIKKICRNEKKSVAVIGTGGTIASYVDYRTGGVHPAVTAEELMNAVPEITEICNIDAQVLFSIYSENIDVDKWRALAEAVADKLRSGYEGCIIPHGTDTMGFTAAALSFMFEKLPRPVVLVGAQRSSDRPSSDAYTNLIASARVIIESDIAEICVLMHESPSDVSALVHRGVKVRKMHASRRDAFKSINDSPIARVYFDGGIDYLTSYNKKNSEGVVLRPEMEKEVALLYFYPGMSSSKFESILTGHKGVVIAGSGLGHVSSDMIKSIAKAIKSGTKIVITSQCLYGRVNLNVYDTGRDLLAAGVIPGEDMLPETAFVKLMWVLANASSDDEVSAMMQKNLRGEICQRRELSG
ncbi:MAG: Glu-tRNA(Gln) amidotransferase subunit GatD [Methanomassiliicoccales archaeon]